MPALTSSGVVINESWYQGGMVMSKRKCFDVTLTLVAQGGLTNNIPASLFGLNRITEAHNFRTSASVLNSGFSPSFDGKNLVVTVAGAVADVTTTVRGLIKGIE